MFDFIKKKIKESIQKILPTERKEEKAEAAEMQRHKQNVRQPEAETRLLAHKVTSRDVDAVFLDLKSALVENNVAVSVLDALHIDLEKKLIGTPLSILSNKRELSGLVRQSIEDVLADLPIDDFIARIRSKKPYVILFIGVNGAGKTTTLAKVAYFLLKHGLKPVASASDTFRAASIEQLQKHCTLLGIDMIKHNYGADPAAVTFDAIKHAKTIGADVVLVDTAGRSDINKNLLEELKKVKRVNKPDLTVFVGDALTGNDVVKQADIFNKEIGIDVNVLSKADVDKKGGAVLSISYVTRKPILFLGTGQAYDDLVPFDKHKTAEFLLD